MSSLGLIFVDQLSKNNLVYESIGEEDSLLFFEPMSSFYELPHHKQKLIYLITSLRKYIPTIRHERVIHEKVTENHQGLSKTLKRVFSEQQFEKLYVTKPSDYQTLKELMFFCQSNSIILNVLEDTKFVSNEEDFDLWSKGKKVAYSGIFL
jgi:deoxyribodipyrimidine photolyase-related protein